MAVNGQQEKEMMKYNEGFRLVLAIFMSLILCNLSLSEIRAQARYDRFEAEGTGQARVYFIGVSGSLKPVGSYIGSFEVAGADGVFYPASAKVVADNQLLVLCDALCDAEVVSLRYNGQALTDDSGVAVDEFTTVVDPLAGLLYPSFRGLLMCGYQAWFSCPGDGVSNGWIHYSNGGSFVPGQCCIDFWPDMTEYTKTYKTPFVYPDGTQAVTFSSNDEETFDLHFRWMKEYGIDGALLQRFKSSIESRPWTKEQVGKAIEAAKRYNRAFILEYDLSGLGGEESVQQIIDDWNWMCEEYGFNDPERCPNYVWENGKPVVGFYGVGAGGKTCKPSQYLEMFDKMRGAGDVEGAISPMAGCGYYWLTSGNDALNFSEWEPVYKRCAVISPWAVGRNSSIEWFKKKEQQVKNDIKWCNDNNVVYAPVALPGFSWRNTKTTWKNGEPTFPSDAVYGQIPRLGGKFFKAQLDSYISWGADAIFVAMFDEMDEGTAIFKLAHADRTPINSSDKNPEGKFLSIEDELGTDHYLKLAGAAAAELKK